MTTRNNDVLGYVKCEAGGRASVHQTKRGKGRFLYTRCDCCGCDQRNGAAVQTRLYRETEWIGEVPTPPPNLLAAESMPEYLSGPPKGAVPPVVEPKKEPVIEPDFEPVGEPEKEPAEASKLGFLSLIGGIVGVVALAIGVAR